jgi:hypothetical protein
MKRDNVLDYYDFGSFSCPEFEAELTKLIDKQFADKCVGWLKGDYWLRFHNALFTMYGIEDKREFRKYRILYNIIRELVEEHGHETFDEMLNAYMML